MKWIPLNIKRQVQLQHKNEIVVSDVIKTSGFSPVRVNKYF